MDISTVAYIRDTNAGNDSKKAEAGGFHSVGFSYGNTDEFTEQKNKDTGPIFCPSFPVPESLLQNLPPTEKVHQIIARTARFVAMHGGQSEIILRVKQGDNPKMGFLMPDHRLHAYFRFLVDHQELLEYGTGGKTLDEEKKAEPGLDQTGGALSLLGSVYGSGEDEDGVIEDAPVNASVPSGSEQLELLGNVARKNDFVSKSSCMTTKEKVNVIKHNRTFIVNGGAISGMKKESSALGPLSTAANKSEAAAIPSSPKVELPFLEPPSDQKRVVDKIVEFILKNGREFEAVLVEQNCKHGRFLFLMPSDQYHPYYLKVLQQAQESKISGKGLVSEKHQSVHVADRKTVEEGGAVSSGSAGHDLPFDNGKKEKFKMVIGKSKKDGLEPPSKAEQPQLGVSLDAAAAILQAATRGIKNPGVEIFPKSSSGLGQGSSNEGGQALSSGSLHISQPQTSIRKTSCSREPQVPVPVAKAIAETAALAAANEADSSEASLTREQKLKAERLKRAKMFASMIKSGSAPSKSETARGFSVEPRECGVSSSGNQILNLSAKEREGSSIPLEADISDKVELEKKLSVDECNERRSRRSYRTKSNRHDGEGDNDLESEDKEEEEEEDRRKHSSKKRRSRRRSRHSSERSRDRHKHKRHSSHKDRDSGRRNEHESSDGENHRHSRRSRHKNNGSDEHLPVKRPRHDSSPDEDRCRHKHGNSSEDEHRHRHRRRHRSVKHRKPEAGKEADLEEGEMYTKSDQSRGSEADYASREASVDFSNSSQIGRAPSQPSHATEVSDDLRAKIRAMLMATL